ncbi:hypothetical protein K2X14_09270 [Acetobacter sp. TBRC 12305]|uniref:Uncharacterized protein n=1 Tax=Acetobacter garciniae TaxID=2817435 RepID=A0A939KRD0_9PROT|nr:hypothetical protein [Acetobacter garciniae]MBX0345023.1 hypothetical protein [Acetobacter garciniae]
MNTHFLLRAACCATLGLAPLAAARAQDNPAGSASIVRSIPTQEAGQGVANDEHFIYAINNSAIGKYDRRTGQRVALWQGDPALYRHINSCQIHDGKLVCAMSNFPASPMTSSVEWFDPATMRHIGSHSFGPGTGSLTWIDWHDGNWWACFANYDVEGSDGGRDHRATVFVRMTPQFERTEAWLFPEEVLERVKPFSISGGRWGKDGLLYVTGHSRPEMYVLALPEAGGRLRYVRTLPMATEGQAFDWDQTAPRQIWSIQRKTREVVESRLP